MCLVQPALQSPSGSSAFPSVAFINSYLMRRIRSGFAWLTIGRRRREQVDGRKQRITRGGRLERVGRFSHVHAERNIRDCGQPALRLGDRDNQGAISLGDNGGLDDSVAVPVVEMAITTSSQAERRRNHAHQSRIRSMSHGDPETKEAIFNFGAAIVEPPPTPNACELGAAGDGFGSPLDVLLAIALRPRR